MSSQSINQVDTTTIRTDVAEIAALDVHFRTQSTKLGAVIRELLEVCSATLSRKVFHPDLEQDADGNAVEADWAGIRFAGDRKQRHTGQGHTTWQWSIYGQSAYITQKGRVYLVNWDGEATDFSGCKGYMDSFTSEVDCDELESHLEVCPESAVEIVEALRKLVAEDKRARKTLTEEMAKVIANLANG